MKILFVALCLLVFSLCTYSQVELLPSSDVRLVLKEAKIIHDKKGKNLTIQAVVESFLGGNKFTDLSVWMFQDRSFSMTSVTIT